MIKAEWTNADALNLQPTCNQLATDCISRQGAINAMMALQAEDDETYGCHIPEGFDGKRAKEALEHLPSAQPELIERTAYIRGFEQGRTQGMIDAQGGKKMNKQRKRKGRDALGRLIVDEWHLEVRDAEITGGEIPHIIRVGIHGLDYKGAWFTCWLEGEKHE